MADYHTYLGTWSKVKRRSDEYRAAGYKTCLLRLSHCKGKLTVAIPAPNNSFICELDKHLALLQRKNYTRDTSNGPPANP